MTDWVRLWHDMPTDPKWRVIARKSGQPLPCVLSVFVLMMANASGNASERGCLNAWDHEDAAAALDMDEGAVRAIYEAMQDKVLNGDRLTGWEKRQPKREDSTASKRKAEWKERKRNASERTGTQENAPETDAETDAETETYSSQPSASKKARAQSFPPPDGVSAEQWENLMACRKAKRAAMTDGAYFQICRKLKEGADAGWPPGELVDRAVERGWTTVFIPQEAPNGRMEGNFGQGGGRGEHPGLVLLREAEAELAAEAEREAQGCH